MHVHHLPMKPREGDPDDSDVLVSGDVTARKSLMIPGTNEYLKPSAHN